MIIMEAKHRTSLEIMTDTGEVFVTTKPANDSGSYCRLGLEAPILQFEVPRTKKTVKFYFSIHMIVSAAPSDSVVNYFIFHGDQINENVLSLLFTRKAQLLHLHSYA